MTRRQLLRLGWGADAIDSAVKRARLYRVHGGVYSVAPVLSPRARRRAATLATSAPLGHASAAVHLGLLAAGQGPVEVITTGRARPQEGIFVRRTRSLPITDVVRREGIPTTTPTRTVLDLAATEDRDVVLEAAMEALHRGVLDSRRVLEADLRGRRGIASIEALRARLRDRTRSELESAMRALCVQAELPAPRCQYRLGRFRVDFAWPEARLAVETDSWAHHSSRQAFETDRARDAWLATKGWTVLRFTWRQLLEQPELVLDALRARLLPSVGEV